VFKNLFLPDVTVVFVMIILGALAGRNMAVRQDGSGGFTRALEKYYLDLGDTVAYGSTKDSQAGIDTFGCCYAAEMVLHLTHLADA
jgi:hypothetical protein